MWLMEGLSEYLNIAKSGKRYQPLHDIIRKGRIRTMYMLGEINLRTFVDADRTLFMKKQRNDEQYAYVLAHALVTFMVENVSRQILGNLIGLLQDNKDKSKVSEK